MATGDIVLTTGLARQGPVSNEEGNLSGSLGLSFGRTVRVYFPDKRLPVIVGQVDPSSRLDVSFDTNQGDFSLKGATVLRGGSVFYIQRNFYLKYATIDFDEDAYQFDPKISLEAETRTNSGTGQVLVTLRAEDSRLSSLSFSLESLPSLSESNIQQLLGQNLIGGTRDGGLTGRVIVENLDIIPQLNVVSILERNLQSVLGLDLFVVRSQLVQRWLYDFSGLSGADEVTSLADYLDDTAIVGGKYVSVIPPVCCAGFRSACIDEHLESRLRHQYRMEGSTFYSQLEHEARASRIVVYRRSIVLLLVENPPKMRKVLGMKRIVTILILLVVGNAVFAQTTPDWYVGKPIKDIRFDGLIVVPSKDLSPLIKEFKGKEFSDELWMSLLARVYELDYFESVEPEAVPSDAAGKAVIIMFRVKEKPAVTSVSLVGNTGLRSQEILDSLSVKERTVFNDSRLSSTWLRLGGCIRARAFPMLL
ncbi:hypothetical protein MASR2M48_27850 [Spirochaetota bacterium]